MKLVALGLLLLVGVTFAAGNEGIDTEVAPTFRLTAEHTTLVVRPQTSAEAYEYLLSTLDQMSFFKENNYAVALPEHPGFRTEGKAGTLEEFEDNVYRAEDFEAAQSRIAEHKHVLQAALEWFSAHRQTNSIHVPEQFTVVLTLYGPGGSYDPSSGTITLFTTHEGEFKGGGGAHTIIHEMMHIGVEERFVQRFALSHWEKERVVDLLTKRELGHLLPGYQLQSQGVVEIGEAIADIPISGLADAIQQYRTHKM